MEAGELKPVLEQVDETIERALNELMEVKIIRENDPTEFAYSQRELQERESEIRQLMEEVSTEEKELLTDALQRIKDAQQTMIRGI